MIYVDCKIKIPFFFFFSVQSLGWKGRIFQRDVDTEWNGLMQLWFLHKIFAKLTTPPPIFRVMSHLNSLPRDSQLLIPPWFVKEADTIGTDTSKWKGSVQIDVLVHNNSDTNQFQTLPTHLHPWREKGASVNFGGWRASALSNRLFGWGDSCGIIYTETHTISHGWPCDLLRVHSSSCHLVKRLQGHFASFWGDMETAPRQGYSAGCWSPATQFRPSPTASKFVFFQDWWISHNTHIIQLDKTSLTDTQALLPGLVELYICGGRVGVTEWARKSEQSKGKSF